MVCSVAELDAMNRGPFLQRFRGLAADERTNSVPNEGFPCIRRMMEESLIEVLACILLEWQETNSVQRVNAGQPGIFRRLVL